MPIEPRTVHEIHRKDASMVKRMHYPLQERSGLSAVVPLYCVRSAFQLKGPSLAANRRPRSFRLQGYSRISAIGDSNDVAVSTSD